jgi:hypothetical protein
VVSGVLVLGGGTVLGVWALASRETRMVSYAVRGQLLGVALDVGDADVTVVRGGSRMSVGVQRTDRFAFGHDARTRRAVRDGVFRVWSRCPATVLHRCSVRYRIVVPDNVPVDVRTGAGRVRLRSYRGSARIATHTGDIHVEAFCGQSLQARAERGSIDAATACAPPQLSLRSTSGSVHAVVPPGRYEVDAESASGRRVVRGILTADQAPFRIQALSSSGDVRVEGEP